MGLSQISCAFYSLELPVGIRYFLDVLATENGSARLVVAVPSIIFIAQCTWRYYVVFTYFRQRAFCRGVVSTQYTLDSEGATCKPGFRLGTRAGTGRPSSVG